MQRAITGWGLDDDGDRFATLECGHRQHTRHNPPWEVREWAATEEARAASIGRTLDCKLCDELAVPEQYAAYQTTPTFHRERLPKGLQGRHSAKPGVWGEIVIEAGTLRFVEYSEPVRDVTVGAGESVFALPGLEHEVFPADDCRFHITFWGGPEKQS